MTAYAAAKSYCCKNHSAVACTSARNVDSLDTVILAVSILILAILGVLPSCA